MCLLDICYYLEKCLSKSFLSFYFILAVLGLFLQGLSLVAVSGGYSLFMQGPVVSVDFLVADPRL